MNGRKLIYFYLIEGDITDQKKISRHHIDAVVNAARPTLMGSSEEGVDRSIHEAVDRSPLHAGETFNDLIRQELDGEQMKPPSTIRCRRGQAVLTGGGGLCRYVIHAVGTRYPGPRKDGRSRWSVSCPSSSVQGLESCYHEIVEILKQHSDIRNLAVPVIGSGNYGYPLEYALRIAVAGLYNAVLDWYKKDPEMFSMENNGEESTRPYIKVYFYLKDLSRVTESERKKILHMLRTFRKYVKEGKKISCQSSCLTQCQYLAEVWKNDSNRGYFAIARTFRLLLLLVRTLFIPLLILKDALGKYSWQGRRCAVEVISIAKVLTGPLFYWLLLKTGNGLLGAGLMLVSVYFLLDTVSYLLALIVLADIQKPSANIIRSLLLLFVNYVEVRMDLAWICYAWYSRTASKLSFHQSLLFAFFGEELQQTGAMSEILSCGREVLSFLFMTFAFGYFLSHVRMQKFAD